MTKKEVSQLIAEIENLDQRIIGIHTRKGGLDTDESQVLKYRRCFLLDKLTHLINGNDEEEDNEEWGEL